MEISLKMITSVVNTSMHKCERNCLLSLFCVTKISFVGKGSQKIDGTEIVVDTAENEPLTAGGGINLKPSRGFHV